MYVITSSLGSCRWTFSGWWFLTCLCISCFCLNALLHIWHTCGRSPVWIVLWFFRAYERRNEDPQMSQGNGRSSRWILEKSFHFDYCMCLNITLFKELWICEGVKFQNTVKSNTEPALNGSFSLSQNFSDPKTNIKWLLRNRTYLMCKQKVKSGF
jgi:hypothetical protein